MILPGRNGTTVLLVALVASVVLACSEEGERPSAMPAALRDADGRWVPDLGGDGGPDVMVLDGDVVRFGVEDGGTYKVVHDAEGVDVVARVHDGATVTCSDEGVIFQTFEASTDEEGTSALRLARLEVSGSTGTLVPSPSFFGFDSDFELPIVGTGCPEGD